jgi:hypothetical protein
LACFLSSLCNCLIFRAFFSCCLLWGKGFTRFCCQVFRALSDSVIKFSALSSTKSARWSSVRSLGVVDIARGFGTRSWMTVSQFLRGILDSRFRRLSIWVTNPVSSPIIPDIHQTQLVTKSYRRSRAKEIIISKA